MAGRQPDPVRNFGLFDLRFLGVSLTSAFEILGLSNILGLWIFR